MSRVKVLRATLLSFAIVFATGFALGPIRILQAGDVYRSPNASR